MLMNEGCFYMGKLKLTLQQCHVLSTLGHKVIVKMIYYQIRLCMYHLEECMTLIIIWYLYNRY